MKHVLLEISDASRSDVIWMGVYLVSLVVLVGVIIVLVFKILDNIIKSRNDKVIR